MKRKQVKQYKEFRIAGLKLSIETCTPLGFVQVALTGREQQPTRWVYPLRKLDQAKRRYEQQRDFMRAGLAA